MDSRILLFYESWWQSAKALIADPSERAAFVMAMMDKAFDGKDADESLPASAAALFNVIGFAANAKCYKSVKAAVGAIGGKAADGQAKNHRAKKNKQINKQVNKQINKQINKQTNKLKIKNKNNNKNEDEELARAKAPVTIDQCISIGSLCCPVIPADYCSQWWSLHDQAGWTDSEDRPIKSRASVQRLLTKWYHLDISKKNNSAAPKAATAVASAEITTSSVLSSFE